MANWIDFTQSATPLIAINGPSPFGLWQTIGLITDRDKARGVPANMCTDIGRVELPFFPSRFLQPRFSLVPCLPSSFLLCPSLEICLMRGTHACLRGKRRGRMGKERKRGNRDTIGPRRRGDRERRGQVFSVRDNDWHQQRLFFLSS